MTGTVYGIHHLPDDDLLWRIAWVDGVGDNTSVPIDTGSAIKVLFLGWPSAATSDLGAPPRGSVSVSRFKPRQSVEGAIAFTALIPERGCPPLPSFALEGEGWTSRKWKTARCKFLETLIRFLSYSDKRAACGKNELNFYVELLTCSC
jgi:hypothetical protein